MNDKKIKKAKTYFIKGYLVGITFCGFVSLLLLIALWIFI